MRPVKYVQVLHDDGRWYEAELLGQHRSGGRWRAVVRYAVAPGMRYQRGVWAEELRPVPGLIRAEIQQGADRMSTGLWE